MAFVERYRQKQLTIFYLAAVSIVLKQPFKPHDCSSQVFGFRSYDSERRYYTTYIILGIIICHRRAKSELHYT